MSVTEAGNPVRVAGEGLTVIGLGTESARLKDLVHHHHDLLGMIDAHSLLHVKFILSVIVVRVLFYFYLFVFFYL
jgi:hypothetical protein